MSEAAARGPRRGLGVYLDLLATPGAVVFVPAGVVARLPISMLGIAIVLLVQGAYGSYALAGGVAAAYAVVSSLCSPLVARAVDARGQAKVMRPAIAVHLVGMTALALATTLEAPVPVLFAAAALMGATIGSVGALVRARWNHVLTRDADPGGSAGRSAARLSTAFSLESVLDEVVFATGPVIVTAVAAAFAPVAALAVAALAVAAGAGVLLAHRSSEPPPTRGHRASAGGGVLTAAGMPLLIVVFVAAGTVFGAVEVVTVAFTASAGVPWAAGLVLAGYAIGSLLAGLVYGTLAFTSTTGRRFVTSALAFGAGVGVLAAVGGVDALASVPVLAAVLFVAGSAISPMLISGTALVREVVAPARLTEGLTWVGTSLGLGVAAGAAGAGAWVDTAGARSALSLPALCGGAVVLVVVLAGRSHLRPHR